MIQILFPLEVKATLVAELRKAGKRESGGLLLGEHVGENLFRLVGMTVQKCRGTYAHFKRDPQQHASQLDEFFRQHGENCARFNYLGEWHSHPSFDVHPSETDLLSMSDLVADPSVGVSFAVLLVVRLSKSGEIVLSATLCQEPDKLTPARVFVEADRATARKRICWL